MNQYVLYRQEREEPVYLRSVVRVILRTSQQGPDYEGNQHGLTLTRVPGQRNEAFFVTYTSYVGNDVDMLYRWLSPLIYLSQSAEVCVTIRCLASYDASENRFATSMYPGTAFIIVSLLVFRDWCFVIGVSLKLFRDWCFVIGVSLLVFHDWCFMIGVS